MTWAKTSPASRGYGSRWQKLRSVIMARDKHLCQPCLSKGRPTPATQVDHIIPKSKGGTDDSDNLRAICTPCHDAKTLQDKGHKPRTVFGADGWPVE